VALTIPQFEDYLRSIGAGEADESGTRYIEDGQGERQRLSQGMLDEMRNGDLTEYQRAQIKAQGYTPMEPYQDVSWFNQNYGTNFGSGTDYLEYLYGPGGSVEIGPDGQQYYKTPGGVDNYKNQPLKYFAPDSTGLKLTKALTLGLATAGMGGFLPGTESVFGAAAGGAGAAGAGAGEFALSAGLPAGAGIGGVGTAGLGLTAPAATSAIGSLGGGLGLTAGAGAAASLGAGGGSSALGGLGDFVTSLFKPTAQGGSGLSVADFAKTGLNYFLNQQSADNLSEAAKTAASMSNPLNDPQRQPYQQDLAALLANPTQFFETNPVVKAQMDLARRQFEANSAKMGVGGTQFNDYLQNVQNNAASSFDNQAKLLAGLAGFNFPSSGSGSTYQQGMQQANTAQNESYRGLWDLGSKIFNSSGAQNFMKDTFSLG